MFRASAAGAPISSRAESPIPVARDRANTRGDRHLRRALSARQRPLAKAAEIKGEHVPQKVDESVGSMLRAGLALGGGRVRRVACRAQLMQVARHPAETDRLRDAKVLELL